MPAAMTMRDGDAPASPTHQQFRDSQPQTPELTDSETVNDGFINFEDIESAKVAGLEMHLTFAKTRIGTLKNELVKEYERAKKAEKRAEEAEKNLGSSDSNELHEAREKMRQVIEERDAALLLRTEAERKNEQAKAKEDRMRYELHNFRKVNELLTADLRDERKMSAAAQEDASDTLATLLKERDIKIDNLTTKLDRVDAEHFACTETIVKMRNEKSTYIDEVDFLKGKKENLEFDLADLRVKLAASERETARIHSDHSRFLHQQQNGHFNQDINSREDNRLTAENDRLKKDIADYEAFLYMTRKNIAFNITQIDLGNKGWRLFNCAHDNFRDIPDGANSTRDAAEMNVILYDILADWVNDDIFLKEYNNARRTILQHHRAHEAVRQGRGVASFVIRNELKKLDEKRGISIKY